MLLGNKNAVIYGGGGSIGGTVARSSPVESASSSSVAPARISKPSPTTSKQMAVPQRWPCSTPSTSRPDEHAQAVVSQAGSIDVSFNLITRGDVQGIPLINMTTDDLLRAVVNGLRSNFITARAAASHGRARIGVILALDSGSANGSPMMGSTGPPTRLPTPSSATWRRRSGPWRARSGHLDGRTPRDVFAEKLAAVDSKFETRLPSRA